MQRRRLRSSGLGCVELMRLVGWDCMRLAWQSADIESVPPAATCAPALVGLIISSWVRLGVECIRQLESKLSINISI